MRSFAKFLADPTRVIVLAPLVFVLHVAEEAPGFVAWFNGLVRDPITQPLFIQVNVAAFVITIIVTALAAVARGKETMVLALAWLSCLMFANAIFHLTGTLVHQRYSPGAVTAALLYLPYFAWFLYRAVRRFRLGAVVTLLAVALGSLPMLAHGYLIVFKGRRLF